MVVNWNCPNCGADLKFDINKQLLCCDHCGYTEEVSEKQDGIKESADDDGRFHCPSCGAVYEAGQYDMSGICTYCGAPLIITERMEGDYRPVKILTFTYDKSAADAAFIKWCDRGKLTPKEFKKKSILNYIRPLYAPYWLSNSTVNTVMSARAERVHTYIAGDEEVIETEYYDVYRDMEMSYGDVDYDGAITLDDEEMYKLDPYSFEALKDFVSPYLAGYEARQYDQGPDEIIPLIQKRVRKYAEDYVRNSVTGYSSVQVTSMETRFLDMDMTFVLLPLWFFEYRYRGEVYNFMMNGQTGKVVGEPPVSGKRTAAWFFGIFAIVFIIVLLIGGFFL
ncbi:MAG: hypothetical protein IJM62_06090 [Lachnospiraceae bacterium]|nr:hypothetical protein [Lachnospiraceae bacterium]